MLQKINPFLSEFIKLLLWWQKQVVGLGLVTLHHCCKQIFLCLGWKNGGIFECEVYLLFTAGEVGGLTGVVFSIYKSTLILNIKLINNFCLHTHLFHKIRGKGLLELHFVSIMYLLTASNLDTIYLALICSRPLTLVFSWISMLAPVHTYPLHWQQDVTSISCNYFQRKEKKTEISDVSFPFIYLHFSYCIYVDYYIIPPGRLSDNPLPF